MKIVAGTANSMGIAIGEDFDEEEFVDPEETTDQPEEDEGGEELEADVEAPDAEPEETVDGSGEA